jgi:hypothetical protein
VRLIRLCRKYEAEAAMAREMDMGDPFMVSTHDKQQHLPSARGEHAAAAEDEVSNPGLSAAVAK